MTKDHTSCSHDLVFVNIRVMGCESYSWTEPEGLVFQDSGGKSEKVPRSGICADCGSRVYREFERI